jgi:acyl-[acyl-carrier-protein]-phospholipid O-acyltransferase/long-chain-fatty-acid--[acyl-carrier-protein] ligase
MIHGIAIRDTDLLIGVLPFFHAFGLTVTLWTPLICSAATAYHTSPLEAEHIGQLTREYKGTILMTTPTLLRLYMARCTPEQFASLTMVATGAEPLLPEVVDAFETRYGLRPFQGYGATEASPVIAFNSPPERAPDHTSAFLKDGTVGRPIELVKIEIRDQESGESLPVGTEGMIWCAGPNVMLGYLGQPEQTAKVITHGWYKTGDIGLLDEDGFLTITGRASQFSKIAGESVPHLLIEGELARLLGVDQSETPVIAVTAVPDFRKGERIVVVHAPIAMSAAELCAGLRAVGLPPLYIPMTDSFIEVDTLPVLPTGKIDLGSVREIANTHFAPQLVGL